MSNSSLTGGYLHAPPQPHIWGPFPMTAVTKPPFRPKQTPFGTALQEAMDHAADSSVWTTEELKFRILSGNDAINIFGKLRPHMNLRPKKWAEMLLRTCPAPTNAYSKTAQFYYHQGVAAGLMYALPLIYGQRRTRFRLSASGVVLLDYYADRWPDFKPYVNAYLPAKAREEIQVDSCDFIMGIEPEWLKKEKEKALAAKDKWLECQKAKEQANLHVYMRRALEAQQATQWNGVPTSAVYESQYQNVLLRNNTTAGSLLGSPLPPTNATNAISNATWSAVQAAAKRLAGKK